MAIASLATEFNTGTSSTSVFVPTTFIPNLIFFAKTGRTEAATGLSRVTYQTSFGWAHPDSGDSWINKCMGALSVDSATAADGAFIRSELGCVITVDAGGIRSGRGLVRQASASGFTFFADDAFPEDFRVGCLAIGGISNVTSSASTIPAATGVFGVSHGLGATPEVVVTLGVALGGTASESAVANNIGFGVGVAMSATSQGGCAWATDEGSATMDTAEYATDDDMFAAYTAAVGNALDFRVDFSSADGSAFTLNKAAGATARRFLWLAFGGGGKFSVSTFNTSETVSTTVSQTLGFQPTGGLLLSGARPENAEGTSTLTARVSFGAFSSTTQRWACGHIDHDSVADARVFTIKRDDACYAAIDDSTTPTVRALLDIDTMGTSGWTFIQDDEEPSGFASFVVALGFGNAVAGAFVPSPYYSHYYTRMVAGSAGM